MIRKTIKGGDFKSQMVGELVFDQVPEVGSFNPVTSDAVAKIAGGVADLDAIVPEGASEENKLATAADVSGVQEDVDAIEGKIPSDTSTTNKLVNESGLQDAIDNASESWSTGFTPKGESSVSDINDLATQSNGDSYIVTDSGTLTDGSLAVVAGDQVAWDATNSVWYKMPQYALRRAVDNISDSIATEFVPNSTTTVAGLPYMYNDVLYVAKEAYQGPWDEDKFEQKSVKDFLAEKINTSEYEKKTLESVIRVSSNFASGDHVSLQFKPESASCAIKLEVDGTLSPKNYNVFAVDSNGVNAKLKLHDSFPLGRPLDVELPVGYDTVFAFTSGILSGSGTGTLYQVFRESVECKLESDLAESLVFATANVANGGRMDISSKPGKKKVNLLVKSASPTLDIFKIYFKDSTGTNPNNTSDSTDYTIDTEIPVTIPDGYDILWIWGQRLNNTGAPVAVTLTDWKNTSGDKIAEANATASEALTTVNNNVNAYNILSQNSIAVGNRMTIEIKTEKKNVDVLLNVSDNYSQVFRIYFKDSTGTNPNDTSDSTDHPTDIVQHVTVPEGYDTIWFFHSGYNTSDSAASVVIKEPIYTSVAYDVSEINESDYLKGKKVVFIGDSVTQFKTNLKGYVEYIGIMSQATCINAGVGGTRYAPRAEATLSPSNSDEAYADLDIYNRVHAWCENDYQYVDAGLDYLVNNNIADPTEFINALKNNPVGNVDIVVLFAGTNDWTGGTYLGDSGTTDTTKTLGALNKCIEEIFTANKDIKIFVVTPIVRYVNNNRTDPYWSDNFVNTHGLTLKQEAKAIQDECVLNKVPVLDAYNTLGWGKYNFSAYFSDSDGTHPYKGWKSLATKIMAFLRNEAY